MVHTLIVLLVTVNVTESCSDTHRSTIKEIHYPPINAVNNTQNNCSWEITVPKNEIVFLTFIELQFNPAKHCDHSFLEVFDGFGINSVNQGKRMCGNSGIKEMKSTGNKITLRYTSTSLNGTDRFKIGYSVSGKYHVKELGWDSHLAVKLWH